MIGIVGGVLAALIVAVLIWCIVKRKKVKSSLPRRRARNKKDVKKLEKNHNEKKSWTSPKIYFNPPTKADLEERIVPSEPFKYFPQADYCSVTDVDPDLYK